MLRRFGRKRLAIIVTLLAISSQACGEPPRAASIAQMATQTQTLAAGPQIETAVPATRTPAPTATAVVIATATPSPMPVTVTAVNGRLAIRTGPDISFDAIAALENGETATAIARSLIDGWVQIPIPSKPGQTGWVSTMTEHSAVIGKVLDLPRIDVVEWQSGAYLVDCTPHRLVVQPGGQAIEPATAASDNRVWFAPGLYSVYDLDLPGTPLIRNLDMPARTVVKILADGNSNRYQCP